MADSALVPIADGYRRFAELEARGRSSAYQLLATAVADDREVLRFLAGLPDEKRQPNLLFAAATLLLGASPDPMTLRGLVAQRGAHLASVMRHRRTQTNEAARCAVLLPFLAALPGPLALLEVGAAAGLTLLPDRYSYDYDGHRVQGNDPHAPTLGCHLYGGSPLPDRVPEIVWRAGIDLNPLDPADADDAAWLECLIWPGEPDRTARLRGAIAAARRCPVPIIRGDLVDRLHDLAAQAPPDASLVVFHTAVLAYLTPAHRRRFAAAVTELDAVWFSNEAPSVLPGLASEEDGGGFLLVRDGEQLVARTDPHGTWLRPL